MNPSQQSNSTIHDRSIVVEVIGLAGAGKSTITNALGRVDPTILCEFIPNVRDVRLAPFFVSNILPLIPLLIHTIGNGDRYLNRRELAWMAMLNGWPNLLERQKASGCHAIVIDQGPIFLIATLLEFGPRGLRYSALEGWWDKIINNWKQALNLVIWLDARDEILTARIRNRDQDHPVKYKTDQEIRAFLELYRRIYFEVMNRLLIDNPRMHILHIDTSDMTVDEVVNRIFQFIKLGDVDWVI